MDGKNRLARSKMLLGEGCEEKLSAAKVLLFGTGGVGSFVLETLARVGVGKIGVVDGDSVDEPDLNRQLIALEKNIGETKCSAAKKRVADVHSGVRVEEYPFFYTPDTKDDVPVEEYDYVVDAIDDVWAKTDIIRRAQAAGVPVVSVMGMGNKLDATKIEVADISKTEVCPLAKAVRTSLRKIGIKSGVKTVFSRETPVISGQKTVGSVPFVPSAAGLIAAGEVIKDLVLCVKK